MSARLSRFKSRVPWRLKLWWKRRRNSELATPRDLADCYRLILNRRPDPEGWATYMSSIRVGAMTRPRLVGCFLESLEYALNRPLADAEKAPVADLPDFRIALRDTVAAIGHEIMHSGHYEPHVARQIQARLSPGAHFVDAGCNVGYFSLLAATRVGATGRVSAFDPSRHNVDLLRRSAALNGMAQIQVYHAALADTPRGFVFFERDGNGVLLPAAPGLEGRGVPVAGVRLADALAEAPRVDGIKIDVEGAEDLVLRGGEALLRKDQPWMLLEFSLQGLRQVSGIEPGVHLQRLVDWGYTLWHLPESGEPVAYGQDTAAVLAAASRQSADHLDLLLLPQ